MQSTPATSSTCSAHRLLSYGRSSHGSHTAGLRPFVANRNICNFSWYGGVAEGGAGEGLDSVGVAPTSPIQERVLYPAPRSPFMGQVILRGPGPFIWFIGAKEGRPCPLHIRRPTRRRNNANVGECISTLLARIRSQAPLCVCRNHSFAAGALAFLGATI